MPSRNLAMIRRAINRLKETLERHQSNYPALAVIYPTVDFTAEKVNIAWRNYQSSAVAGDKEREERDNAVNILVKWIQRWRPVLLMLVPGADKNIRNLPSRGATPDDVIRVSADLVEFIKNDPGAESFRAAAIDDLGDGIANARKETSEAADALPAEAAARQAYSEACLEANNILIRGTEIVRAIFGRTSPEYKQFIARSSSSEEDEIENESLMGEE